MTLTTLPELLLVAVLAILLYGMTRLLRR